MNSELPIDTSPSPELSMQNWYFRSGPWFWCVLVLGLAIRLYLVLFTQGTKDVQIWQQHARDVCDYGLIAYYHGDPSANHPPFITEVEAFLLRISDSTGVPFRILLRAPFALLDLGTTLLLLLILGGCRWRWVAAAAYWLNPISIIFSAYHGNTDSAVAFFLMLCVWLLSRNKSIAAAMALGISLWIKLPVIAAIPALAFFIPTWSRRLQFLAIAGVIGLATYVPALVLDPAIIWKNVFGYRAPLLGTSAGVASWGPVLIFSIVPAEILPESITGPLTTVITNGWLISLAIIVILVWLRRSLRQVSEVCATIAVGYIILLAFSFGFAFQYFAWSLPFWFFLPRWFLISAILLVSAYVYGLYAYLCGNPWLVGLWDFGGHPLWPAPIIALRNAAYLFFWVAAIWLVVSFTIRAIPSRR